jgi:hypothetical protein
MVDYKGARGSNAGDDFHALWVLKYALELLDPESNLLKIHVEGVANELSSDNVDYQDTWEGVDYSLYYGSDDSQKFTKLILAQCKYSSATPIKSWTISDFVKKTSTKNNSDRSKPRKNNSIIRKFSKEFQEVNRRFPELINAKKLQIEFVTNRPISTDIKKALNLQDFTNTKNRTYKNRQKLLEASELTEEEFDTFSRLLILPEKGKGSRIYREEIVTCTISKHLHDDATTKRAEMLWWIYQMMMPGDNRPITRETVLQWMGVSDIQALFPCPSKINVPEKIITREQAENIVEYIQTGKQYLYIHGQGGCGKTTLLQEVKDLLPDNSIFLLYDCFGEGEYLDASSFRHRPHDAFLQLSNELSVLTRLPMLINKDRSLDYPKIFKQKLLMAADYLSQTYPKAKLVVAIDAIDNSIIANETQSTQEKCFIDDILTFDRLPENVCLLVTLRTGRLHRITFPHRYIGTEIGGFSKDNTKAFVESITDQKPEDSWIDDFHYLTSGNPRVQSYVLDYSENHLQNVLESLRPSGKTLNVIFEERIKEAIQKSGSEERFFDFLTFLELLPRPIPVEAVSNLLDTNGAEITDLCLDLTPGISLNDSYIQFRDEDFEFFLSQTIQAREPNEYHVKIADFLWANKCTDIYAATHVAQYLYSANQPSKIFTLVNQEIPSDIVSDLILQKEIRLKRIQIAMRVSHELKNIPNIFSTLLAGAKALQSTNLMDQLMIDNPQLSAEFASGSAIPKILYEPENQKHQGRLLFHLSASYANQGNKPLVRETLRQKDSWMVQRDLVGKKEHQEFKHRVINLWPIESEDIAAEIEAVLKTYGAEEACYRLFRWKPRYIPLFIAKILLPKLLAADEEHLIYECIEVMKTKISWSTLFLQVPLALAGKQYDVELLQNALNTIHNRGYFNANDFISKYTSDETKDYQAYYYQTILTACEIAIVEGIQPQLIEELLTTALGHLHRFQNGISKSESVKLDFALRLFMLSELLANRIPNISSFVDLISKNPNSSQEALKQPNNRDSDLKHFITPVFDIYLARAKILIEQLPVENSMTLLNESLRKFNKERYWVDGKYDWIGMRRTVANSLSILMVCSEINNSELLSLCETFLDRSLYSLDKDKNVLQNFVLDQNLRQSLLKIYTKQYQAVKDEVTKADEKRDMLLSLAYKTLLISPDDSKIFYNEAINAVEEIDENIHRQIKILNTLAQKAALSMSKQSRRCIAQKIAQISIDAGRKLADTEYFPWSQSISAVSYLDIPTALALIARLGDEDLLRYHSELLQTVLLIGLRTHEISPKLALVLSPFFDLLNIELAEELIKQCDLAQDDEIIEFLAKHEVIHSNGVREALVNLLNNHSSNETHWQTILNDQFAFLQQQIHQKGASKVEMEGKIALKNELDWSSFNFSTTEGIEELLSSVQSAGERRYGITSDIEDTLIEKVPLRSQVRFLNTLSDSQLDKFTKRDFAKIIIKCLDQWQFLSVTEWKNHTLLDVIKTNLLKYAASLSDYDEDDVLPALLSKLDRDDSVILGTLLSGIELHLLKMPASTLFALLKLSLGYVSPDDAEVILEQSTDDIVNLITDQARVQIDMEDIPSSIEEAISRFIYAYMGDIDVRKRWRSAHALRLCGELNQPKIINNTIPLYERTDEHSFRNPATPFYWVSARIWLFIALDKIAIDQPNYLKQHVPTLLDIATSESFPHLIIRELAKNVLGSLINSGNTSLSDEKLEKLRLANRTSHPRIEEKDPYRKGFDHYSYKDDERGGNFHFNSMDMLPYWYSFSLRIFADVAEVEFLKLAERWITQSWQVKEEVWVWNNEPRVHLRYDSKHGLTSYSHGAYPIIERYYFYLQTNAMWCTIGELLKEKSLNYFPDDNWHSFEKLIARRIGHLVNHIWMADLVAPKPNESIYWDCPSYASVKEWVDNILEDDFLREAGISSLGNSIKINSSTSATSNHSQYRCYVRSALVSPITAASFLRMYQAEDSGWDCLIPYAGDDAVGVEDGDFVLKGWYRHRDSSDSDIQEWDPLRHNVEFIQSEPASEFLPAMDVSPANDSILHWLDNSTNELAFAYTAWGDEFTGDDVENGHRHYSEVIDSKGWRLCVEPNYLRQLLTTCGLDLIILVDIEKEKSDSSYKDRIKNKQQKLLLLRKEGTLEDTTGIIGTWRKDN